MKISVVIRTHNPRPPYLTRVLQALRDQTFPKEQWELLLIDNASREQLAAVWDLSWHPHGRCIREDTIGITAAMLRGIRESRGDYVVLVDDDNVLDLNYLERADELFRQWPQLGAIGTGVCLGEFEINPPEWIDPYIGLLAISRLDRDYFANFAEWNPASPFGAGMCVHRAVAELYAEKFQTHPLRKLLGRNGTGLSGGEDGDLAWCSVDLGLGTGRFLSLKLTHLIPKVRLTQEYLVRLSAGNTYAEELTAYIRKNHMPGRYSKWKMFRNYLKYALKKKTIKSKMTWANLKARKQVRDFVHDYHAKNGRHR